MVHGLEAGEPPELDWEREGAVQAATRRAIEDGIVHSAHDCSEGGLAVALAECCISGEEPIGAEVDLNACGCPDGCEEPIRADALLFGESQSRIILTVPAESAQDLLAIAEEEGAPAAVIGRVRGDRLVIGVEGEDAIDIPVDRLHGLWDGAFEKLMAIAPQAGRRK